MNRLEKLNDLVGELVILRSLVESSLLNHGESKTARSLEKLCKDIQDMTMSLRMVSVGPIFQKLNRVVRDTSKLLGKNIELRLMGEDTEIDKTVIESLSDPLVHIVRNSLDHGIETSEARLLAGKSEAGTVEVMAFHEGNYLVIQITDDGKGINPDTLINIAMAKGIIGRESNLTHQQGIELIFHPGFSTKDAVSEISGRGVGMDGVTFLEKYLPLHPIPTVMISSVNIQESDLVMRALEIGAVDYLQKPSFEEIKGLGDFMREKVLTASSIKVKKEHSLTTSQISLFSEDDIRNKFIAIGASTGGTEAIKELLLKLPENIPPIVIVQHIPPVFSLAFAKRLNELCPFEVIEGKDGDEILPGRVIVAPGGLQMEVARRGSKYFVKIFNGERVNRHKPSVDTLFNSVATHLGDRTIGVILTGMGNDGAEGLLRMRKAGAFTIAQDEQSSVVYGMPRIAAENGAAMKVLPLQRISQEIIQTLKNKVLKVS